MQGFFLGISSGAACIAYCAPALLPYILGEGKNFRENSVLLAKFLLGRLLGYLFFACALWLAGQTVQLMPLTRELIQSVAYIVLALLLFSYGVKHHASSCIVKKLPLKPIKTYPQVLPWLMGLLTGLNLCPPFLLLFVEAAASETLMETIWCFFMFFLGTALYFMPIPLLGMYQNKQALQTVGQMAAVLMSLYYLYSGSIMLLKGALLL